jgi:hypothetical protein
MAIFTGKKKSTTLIDTLADKAVTLRAKQSVRTDDARHFAELSAEAANDATVAATQAKAVEQALTIVTDAGVEL